MSNSPTVQLARAAILVSLVLVVSFGQFLIVRAVQPVSTEVKWLNDKHTLAQVTITFSDGTKTVYVLQTNPTGPPNSAGLSIISLKAGTLAVGGSFGTKVSVSRLPYPSWASTLVRPATTIQIHLTATALAVTALVIAVVAVVADYYGNPTVLRILIAALVNLLTFVLTDRNPDWSLDMWVPLDWYNAGLAMTSKSIYVGTPHYWWQAFSSMQLPARVAGR